MAATSIGIDVPEKQPHKDHLRKYVLIRTIGQGSFAKVKLARHAITGQEVGIKMIDKAKMSKDNLEKLYREIRIMKLIKHPNIIQLFEVIENEKLVYLVMEYASGGEVFDYLVAHGRMKEREARNRFREILSAVEFCHQKRVIHRDLKAENLLLDSKLKIKLADFGFANEYTPGGRLSTFCGSPPYAAPEIFQGVKYEGPEVDVWSLGVILYTLVSGYLPFDGSNLSQLRDKVIRCRYKVPSYMSNDCEHLLKKMLVICPTKRFTLPEIMKDKWVNMGFENIILSPFVEPPAGVFDPVCLGMMESLGYTEATVLQSLQEKSFNGAYGTYHQLKHYLNNNTGVTADFTFDTFDTSKYDPNATVASMTGFSSAIKAAASVPSSVTPSNNVTPSRTSGVSRLFNYFYNAMHKVIAPTADTTTAPKAETTVTPENKSEISGKTINDDSSIQVIAPKSINAASIIPPKSNRTNTQSTDKRKMHITPAGIPLAGPHNYRRDSKNGLKIVLSGNNPQRRKGASPQIPAKSIVNPQAPASDPDSLLNFRTSVTLEKEVPSTGITGFLNHVRSNLTKNLSHDNRRQSITSNKNSNFGAPFSGTTNSSAIPLALAPSINVHNSTQLTNTGSLSDLSKSAVKHKDCITGSGENIASKYQRLSPPSQHNLVQEQLQLSNIGQLEETKYPRSIRFAWNAKTTSTKKPAEIMQEIVRVLLENKCSFHKVHNYLLVCESTNPECVEFQDSHSPLKWEMEVCKLPYLRLNGIRFKRISGRAMAYKSIAISISQQLKL